MEEELPFAQFEQRISQLTREQLESMLYFLHGWAGTGAARALAAVEQREATATDSPEGGAAHG